MIQHRQTSYIKCRTLFKVIQDLRRQYSGAIPIAKQEKLTGTLLEMNEDKRKANNMLRKAEEKALEAELKAEELAIKLESIEELKNKLTTSSKKTKITLDWQEKIEELRLKELRSRRTADSLVKEVEYLRDVTKTQAAKIDQLEVELLRSESQMENRELDWETRAMELEISEEEHTERKEKASSNVNLIPDTDLPLAQQLEIALNTIKDDRAQIENLKTRVNESKKITEELSKKLRESEAMAMAKDKLVNDLRLQIPNTVDRAVAMASVTGSSGLMSNLTEDYESHQALKIAQTTVDSLRERLKQKEETLARYEGLLQQMRSDHMEALQKRQEEMLVLQSTIRSQQQAFNELKSSNSEKSATESSNPTGVIATQSNRIHELEDEVQELQGSVTKLSNQLSITRTECDKLHNLSNNRLKEINDLKDNLNVESKINQHRMKTEIDELTAQITLLKQENVLLKENVEKSPIKKATNKLPQRLLVEKLKSDVAEKDKKLKALSRVITDLKSQMLEAADKTSDLGGRHSPVKFDSASKLKIDELMTKNDRLERQLKVLKDREVTSYGEIKSLKEDLNKKGSLILKMREEKMNKKANSNTNNDVKEKEEMRNTIKRLEDKIKSLNKAERPLEDEDDKAVRTAEELARWDESKKWQSKIEILRSKNSDANEQVSKLSKTNKALRDTITRLEREILTMKNKLKNTQKVSSNTTNLMTVKMEEILRENEKLKEEISTGKHLKMLDEDQGVETYKLRNKFLQERIEAQERKISFYELNKKNVPGGEEKVLKSLTEIQEKEKLCQKQKLQLEEVNLALKLQIEQLRVNSPRLSQGVNGLKELNDLISKQTPYLDLKNKVDEIIDNFNKVKTVHQGSPPGKKMKGLLDDLEKLKKINVTLVEKIEARDETIKKVSLKGQFTPKIIKN